MKKSLACIWYILGVSNAFAGGWDDFGRGFFNGPTAQRQSYQQEQQAIYQANFNAVMSELQRAQYLQYQQRAAKQNEVHRLVLEDEAKCNTAPASQKTIVAITNCVNKSIISRNIQGEYPYMPLVYEYTEANKAVAEEYSKGKITIPQYNERISQMQKRWAESERTTVQQVQEKMHQAMVEIAHKHATEMTVNQQQARFQQNEIDDLSAKIDAMEARNQAEQLRRISSPAANLDSDLQRMKNTQQSQQAELDKLKRENQRLKSERPY
jgi:hypothetical protein